MLANEISAIESIQKTIYTAFVNKITVKNMKALSMPVEMIVVIALAVIVLLAAAAFFVLGWGPQSGAISDSSAWQKACGQAKQRGCLLADFTATAAGEPIIVPEYDVNKDGTPEGILTACSRNFGYNVNSAGFSNNCWARCCSTGGSSTVAAGGGTDDASRRVAT